MTDVLEKIRLMVEPLLEGTDMFIVSIKIKPINNIKLYIDADEGLNITKSAGLNRKLYRLIEEEQMYPEGDFSLEVSSPGIDEPLVPGRQFKKNLERTVLVTMADATEVLGVLKEVKDDSIVLEVKQGKKKDVIVMTELSFADIKKTVVQVIF